ncbi:putative C6 transcription factor [Leptodontidium sp. 2 PMI_412]|nr:putative C6 transcription factor [Leptodontidium sp. 2 PMI_412]
MSFSVWRTERARRSRKHITRACDSCFIKKIKCEPAVPKCDWCNNQDIPCTYERPIGKRGEKISDIQSCVSRPEERLGHTKELLTESPPSKSAFSQTPNILGHHSIASVALTTNSPATSSAALQSAGYEYGIVSLITGIPLFGKEGQLWIKSRTGEPGAFDKLDSTYLLSEKRRQVDARAALLEFRSPNPTDLPDREMVMYYFNTYNSSMKRLIFPVLNPTLFRRTVEIAYLQSSSPSSIGQVSARACILAFIAFLSTYHETTPSQRVMGAEYAIKAQSLVPFILQECNSVDALQTMVILSLFELTSGSMQSARHFLSLAGNIIFILGAHRASRPPRQLLGMRPRDVDASTQKHLRNIFWLCYTLDKDLALRTGYGHILSDEVCDLTIPPGYVDNLFRRFPVNQPTDLPDDIDPLFPLDLRLSIIKSRAYRMLFSPQALRKMDVDLLNEVRELDEELEQWRLSVPGNWRPTVSFCPESSVDSVMNMRSIMLRLNYHYCMTIIHLATSRCELWLNLGAILEGLGSSLAISVEAGRSTLLYLEAAEHIMDNGIFWPFIFYPLSALFAIFCNILQRPQDPRSSEDLGLLKKSTSMIERIFTRQSSSINESVQIDSLVDLVNELSRLADLAIEQSCA